MVGDGSTKTYTGRTMIVGMIASAVLAVLATLGYVSITSHPADPTASVSAQATQDTIVDQAPQTYTGTQDINSCGLLSVSDINAMLGRTDMGLTAQSDTTEGPGNDCYYGTSSSTWWGNNFELTLETKGASTLTTTWYTDGYNWQRSYDTQHNVTGVSYNLHPGFTGVDQQYMSTYLGGQSINFTVTKDGVSYYFWLYSEKPHSKAQLQMLISCVVRNLP